MLAKQWLNRYARVEMRGYVIGHNRHWQRKMDGMVAWHSCLAVECLLPMLQAALLRCAHSNYLSSTNTSVIGIVISLTAFGLLFYLLTVSAATISQLPIPSPLVLRFLVCFDDERKYLKWTRKWFGYTPSGRRYDRD